MKLIIRQETKNDFNIVYNVVKSAFKAAEHSDGDEHNLVNRLRESKNFIPQLSLVAENKNEIIGHILFTKVTINKKTSLALAPVAVIPQYQDKGVGSGLILEGHNIAKNLGFSSVVVLGHPRYYPKFGYQPASNWNIKPPFDVPDDCFMAIELVHNGLKGVSGTVLYPEEFFI
ncbi:MAG: GNAT family N-acetyltransferase [Alphaproteobacteria bacterium]